MTNEARSVASPEDLAAALDDAAVRDIVVAADLEGLTSIRLRPGQRLRSTDEWVLQFAAGEDGVELTTDNVVETVGLVTDPNRRALFNSEEVGSLGQMRLANLELTGCVRILVRGTIRSGHVEAHDIDIVSADARDFPERPAGFGVEVQPGAFTLWNMSDDPEVRVSANLTGIGAGRPGAPVRGSGIFVGGAAGDGGSLAVGRLETGEIHSDGGIAPGTPDRISGGVFTSYGALIDTVRNCGPVTTYGPNDMVLDNWGMVDRWIAEAKISSHGPSGIGFVNFGTIDDLQIAAPIETRGQGARGLNVYAGTIRSIDLDRVVTRADGAVGIQISQPVGHIVIRRGIETFGGTGDSLVKGVVKRLTAIPLSIKPGGSALEVIVAGGITAHGSGVAPIELHGTIERLSVEGSTAALGGGFEEL